jgi:hypothetical protein
VSRPGWRAGTAETVRSTCNTVSMTCISDGRAHAVRDTEIASGAGYQSGHFAAVCGHIVTPASMVAPDGELCRACAERDAGHRRRRRHNYYG